jgi:protein-disulfide isomerase
VDKRFLVILTVLILGLGGLFIFTKDKNSTPDTNGSVSSHVKGSGPVQITVYGDFQCPVCRPFYYLEKQLLEKYPNQITLTFKHFPIDSIHPNARAAARAAEAAGLQGQFFEMHDMLYENQDSWAAASNPQPTFEQYATSLGLDLGQFSSDYASEAVNNTINADKAAAGNLGVEGTPTYFLNGEKLNNDDIRTLEGFSAKIEAALQTSAN